MTSEPEVVDVHDEHHRMADAGRTVRSVLAGIIVAALIALVIDNRREVRVSWIFGDGDAQLWMIVVLSAIAGAAVGWLVSHRPRRRR